jgi:hypothetical protein
MIFKRDDSLFYLVVFLCITSYGMLVGNYAGDQAILRECTKHSSAKMLGGGTITCTVQKEPTSEKG